MGAEASNVSDPWVVASAEIGAEISPVMFEQLNLLTVKQHLRKTSKLTVEQMKVISDVTGEKVRSIESAINALVRLFGYWDSTDNSAETLVKLRSFDKKLSRVRATLGLPPSTTTAAGKSQQDSSHSSSHSIQGLSREHAPDRFHRHRTRYDASLKGEPCSPRRRRTVSHLPSF